MIGFYYLEYDINLGNGFSSLNRSYKVNVVKFMYFMD